MSGQPNLVTDVGTLLKLPNKVTAELIHKANLCIGSIINDAKLAGEQTIIINVGIGTLSVDLVDMQCKFVPSKDLKTSIKGEKNCNKNSYINLKNVSIIYSLTKHYNSKNYNK